MVAGGPLVLDALISSLSSVMLVVLIPLQTGTAVETITSSNYGIQVQPRPAASRYW